MCDTGFLFGVQDCSHPHRQVPEPEGESLKHLPKVAALFGPLVLWGRISQAHS